MDDYAKENIEKCRRTRSKSLDLIRCGITDLSFISDMTWLTRLILSSNNLIDLTPLQYLTNLTILDLSDNRISEVTHLQYLTNLTILDISYNCIEDITPLQYLTNLKYISLSQNYITEVTLLLPLLKKGIPVYWEYGGQQEGVFLEANPLDHNLIAYIYQGNAAVIEYLEKLQSQKRVRINEAKLMIVGEPMAGKTTLRLKLRDTNAAMPAIEARTEGVYIDKETCRFEALDMDTQTPIPFYYHIWDFGGQKVYKPISQLFITQSTLYVAVINADKGTERKEIVSWFESIEKLTNNSPVIVLQNGVTDPVKTTDLKAIKERFTDMWRGEHVLNLRRTATNIADHDPEALRTFEILRGRIHAELQLLPHRQSTLPESYALVRQAIADKGAVGHLLPYTEFEKICHQNGITDAGEQLRLSMTFHILGTYLHYQNNDTLQDTIILHNNWATDAAYVVLHSDIVSRKEGHFDKADIAQIWTDPTYRGRQKQLVALMQEFRLCYLIRDTTTYVVPYCLPLYDAKIKDWDTRENVRLTIKYDFLPGATVVKLLVGLHEYIADGQTWIWQKGGVINGNQCHAYGTFARIEQDEDNRQLVINVRGSMSMVLFGVILNELDSVNKPYEKNLTIKKLIACYCDDCKKSPEPEYFDYYKDLLRHKFEKNLDRIYCKNLANFVNIDKLLRGVISEEQIRRDAREHADTARYGFDRLEKTLTPLETARQHIAKGKTQEAIETLMAHFGGTKNMETLNVLILQSGSFTTAKTQHTYGFLNDADFKVETTKVNNALLTLITEA